MNRQQFEHVVRAASGITGTTNWIVIGSQSILGSVPTPPPELTLSMELDLYTLRATIPGDPSDAEVVEGTIGRDSIFHTTHGYFADGVDATTATLPSGWNARLIPTTGPDMPGAVAECLEPHDLAVSKLVAGRDKDLVFIRGMLRHGIVSEAVLRERLTATELVPAVRSACEARLVSINRL